VIVALARRAIAGAARRKPGRVPAFQRAPVGSLEGEVDAAGRLPLVDVQLVDFEMVLRLFDRVAERRQRLAVEAARGGKVAHP